MTGEEQLIGKAQQGDAVAFGQLVRLYQDRLFTSIMHLMGQREEAEDIVQDAFVQALLKLPGFRRQSSFYTWLYRIAINVALNRQRRSPQVISLEPANSQPGHDPTDPNELPADRLLRTERARQIQTALGRLSEEYRTVLVLREIDGFDYDAIARILNISVGTVRSRLHRARSLMRDQLRHIHHGSTLS